MACQIAAEAEWKCLLRNSRLLELVEETVLSRRAPGWPSRLSPLQIPNNSKSHSLLQRSSNKGVGS
jgi:hypothetical protein